MSLTEQELLEYRLKVALEDLDCCRKAALLQPFRAGDRVKHAGTGETWVLACDQQDNDVLPAGWPETLAKATHCRLVEAATDAARREMLTRVSQARPGVDSGRRSRLAAAQLVAVVSGAPPPAPAFFDPGPSRYDAEPECTIE